MQTVKDYFLFWRVVIVNPQEKTPWLIFRNCPFDDQRRSYPHFWHWFIQIFNPCLKIQNLRGYLKNKICFYIPITHIESIILGTQHSLGLQSDLFQQLSLPHLYFSLLFSLYDFCIKRKSVGAWCGNVIQILKQRNCEYFSFIQKKRFALNVRCHKL